MGKELKSDYKKRVFEAVAFKEKPDAKFIMEHGKYVKPEYAFLQAHDKTERFLKFNNMTVVCCACYERKKHRKRTTKR